MNILDYLRLKVKRFLGSDLWTVLSLAFIAGVLGFVGGVAYEREHSWTITTKVIKEVPVEQESTLEAVSEEIKEVLPPALERPLVLPPPSLPSIWYWDNHRIWLSGFGLLLLFLVVTNIIRRRMRE